MTNVADKIKLFNSDEMMGQEVFDKLQAQINDKQQERTILNDKLTELKNSDNY